jgi:hypothetical protein
VFSGTLGVAVEVNSGPSLTSVTVTVMVWLTGFVPSLAVT